MQDLWAHWTRAARRLHSWVAMGFVFLLVTGLIFYMPSLRGATAGIRHALRQAHVVVGLALVGLAAAALWDRGLRAKLLRRGRVKADLVLGLLFILLLAATGIPLWLPERFAIGPRNLAVYWHARVALVGGAWLAYHTFAGYALPLLRLWRRRSAERREVRRREALASAPRPVPVYSRRDFMRQLGWAATLLAFLGFVRPWDLRLRRVSGPPVAGAFTGPGPMGAGAEIRGAGKLHQFRIYTVTMPMPDFDPKTYRLIVDGMVEQPLELTFDQVLALPSVHDVSDFHCVTGWGVEDVEWEGVRIEEIIRRVRPRPGAGYITFYSMDGVYTDSLSIAQATAPGVLLAYKMMGAPLKKEHGAPLRVIIPQMYGYKGVKWLYRMEFTDRQVVGYWEQRGYPIDAYIGAT